MKDLASRETGTGLWRIFLNSFFKLNFGKIMAQCKFKHMLESLTTQIQYTHLCQAVIKNDNGTSMEIQISFHDYSKKSKVQLPMAVYKTHRVPSKKSLSNEEILLDAILLSLLPISNLLFSIDL